MKIGFIPGVDLSDGRATNPPLDLVYVRNKLSGSGPIVQVTSVVAVSSTTVRVKWNTRRNRRYIEGYHVRWRTAGRREGSAKGDGFVDVTVEGADVTEFTLEGLRPHTAYDINVRPWYRTVVGLESKTLLVRTREDGKYLLYDNVNISEKPIHGFCCLIKLVQAFIKC